MKYGAFFTRRGRQGGGQGHRARRRTSPTTCSAKASIRPTRRSASAITSSACSASWRRKGASARRQNQDDQVFAPYTTVMKKLSGQLNLNRIYVSARSADDIARRHGGDRQRRCARATGSTPGDPDDFTVQTLDDIVALRTQTTQHDDDAARRHRVRLAGRRRHRHHEHHAGVGHRAHARDRPAPGHRRARLRRAAAVPDRGRRHQPRSAGDRHRPRAICVSEARRSTTRTGRRWCRSTRSSRPWRSRRSSASSSGSTRLERRRGWIRSRRCGSSSEIDSVGVVVVGSGGGDWTAAVLNGVMQMKRAAVLVSALAVVLYTVGMSAQATELRRQVDDAGDPNVGARPPRPVVAAVAVDVAAVAAAGAVSGMEVTITQDASDADDQQDGGRSDPTPVTLKFTLDGKDSKNTVMGRGGEVVTTSQATMAGGKIDDHDDRRHGSRADDDQAGALDRGRQPGRREHGCRRHFHGQAHVQEVE